MRAAGVSVPTTEGVGTRFQRSAGIGRLVVVLVVHRFRECLFIGEALRFLYAILIIIDELIAVAGIIELCAVVVASIFCADARIAREAFQIVALLIRNRQPASTEPVALICRGICMVLLVGSSTYRSSGFARQRLNIICCCSRRATSLPPVESLSAQRHNCEIRLCCRSFVTDIPSTARPLVADECAVFRLDNQIGVAVAIMGVLVTNRALTCIAAAQSTIPVNMPACLCAALIVTMFMLHFSAGEFAFRERHRVHISVIVHIDDGTAIALDGDILVCFLVVIGKALITLIV